MSSDPSPPETTWFHSIRTRLVVVSLLLVCAPLLVVSLVGVYERVDRDFTMAELEGVSETFGEQIREHDLGMGEPGAPPPDWLSDLAQEHHVLFRAVDSEGREVYRTSDVHSERLSEARRMIRGASAFVFGEVGPPDVRAFESNLPSLGDRREVRAALDGRASTKARVEDDSLTILYTRAEVYPSDDGAFLVTRVSRRGIRRLYASRFQLFRLTAILAAIALAFGAWTGMRLVNPLLLMRRRIAEYRSAPDARSRAEIALDHPDELGALSREFQELADLLRERLEQSSELAADLAHDMKNPIATVEATAEMLASGQPIDESRQQRLSRALGSASSHLRRSVEGMLELARLEEALSSSHREAIDLGELVTSIIDELREDPAHDGIDIESKTSGKPMIRGARPELELLARNLLSNALAFCDRQVFIEARSIDSGAEIRISDDGPGVSEGNREKIFKRFFTARPKGTESGTGLGLAIVRSIAEAHGGTVELLEESPLPGACFRVMLP